MLMLRFRLCQYSVMLSINTVQRPRASDCHPVQSTRMPECRRECPRLRGLFAFQRHCVDCIQQRTSEDRKYAEHCHNNGRWLLNHQWKCRSRTGVSCRCYINNRLQWKAAAHRKLYCSILCRDHGFEQRSLPIPSDRMCTGSAELLSISVRSKRDHHQMSPRLFHHYRWLLSNVSEEDAPRYHC
jgi:hypothetical protein